MQRPVNATSTGIPDPGVGAAERLNSVENCGGSGFLDSGIS